MEYEYVVTSPFGDRAKGDVLSELPEGRDHMVVRRARAPLPQQAALITPPPEAASEHETPAPEPVKES